MGDTVVIYYSYTGRAEDRAKAEAISRDAELIEMVDVHHLSALRALLKGCPKAYLQKSSPVVGALPDLTPYTRFVVVAPVWMGFPAPAFNTIVDMIPAGGAVDIVLTSDMGDTGFAHDKVVAFVERHGLTVTSYKDVKADPLLRISRWAF